MTNPIKIKITHTVYETDFGPYHDWRLVGDSSTHNDEAAVRAKAQECVDKLRDAGIPAEVEVLTYKTPFPEGW